MSSVYKTHSCLSFGTVTRHQLYNVTRGSLELVQRLHLESKFPVHNGCVNSICWNDSGTHILSGSDDQHLCVTNPFTGKIETCIHTSHKANIFCAKFLPCSSDKKLISCSGDGKIYYTDLDSLVTDSHSSYHGFTCHTSTVYELLTVPNDPNTFLSCGEDGTVRWFDLRIKDRCNERDCKQDVLINCRRPLTSLAINPCAAYELAVACSDSATRIFDRRMLGTRATGSYFGRGMTAMVHCVRASWLTSRSHRITSLQYSPDGNEILVNYSGDQICLFNIRENERKDLKADAKESASSSQVPPKKRLRLRGDWSDTGPNARPLTERTQQEEGPPTLLQRMSDMLTHWLDVSANDRDAMTAEPPRTENQDPGTSQRRNQPSTSQNNQLSTVQSDSQPSTSDPGNQSNTDQNRSQSITDASNTSHSGNQLNTSQTNDQHDTGQSENSQLLNSTDQHQSPCTSTSAIPSCSNSTATATTSSFGDVSGERYMDVDVDDNDASHFESQDLNENMDGEQSDKDEEGLELQRQMDAQAGQIAEAASTTRNDGSSEADGSVEHSSTSYRHEETQGIRLLRFGTDETQHRQEQFTELLKDGTNISDIGGVKKVQVSLDYNNMGTTASTVQIHVSNSSIGDTSVSSSAERARVSTSNMACTSSTNSIDTHSNMHEEVAHNLTTENNSGTLKGDNDAYSDSHSFSNPNNEHFSGASAENNQVSNSGVSASNEDTKILSNDTTCQPADDNIMGIDSQDDADSVSVDGDIKESGVTGETSSCVECGSDGGLGTSQRSGVVMEHSGSDSGVTSSDVIVVDASASHVNNPRDIISSKTHKASNATLDANCDDSSPSSNFNPDEGSTSAKTGHGDSSMHANTRSDENSNNHTNTSCDNAGPFDGSDGGAHASSRVGAHAGNHDSACTIQHAGSSSSSSDGFSSDNSNSTSSSEADSGRASSSGQAAGQPVRERRFGRSGPPTGSSTPYISDSDSTDDTPSRSDRNAAARKLQDVFRRRREVKEREAEETISRPVLVRTYRGHRNTRTMIKQACFYGSDFVLSGSDCGHMFIWDRHTGKLVNLLEADEHVVNSIQPHPMYPVIATSGIDYDIKLWMPTKHEASFDSERAKKVTDRNELMLEETRDTITVPASFMLRIFASLNQIRAGRRSADDASSSSSTLSDDE